MSTSPRGPAGRAGSSTTEPRCAWHPEQYARHALLAFGAGEHLQVTTAHAPVGVDRAPQPADAFGAAENPTLQRTFDPPHMPPGSLPTPREETRLQFRSGAVSAPQFLHTTIIADRRELGPVSLRHEQTRPILLCRPTVSSPASRPTIGSTRQQFDTGPEHSSRHHVNSPSAHAPMARAR